MLRNNFDTAHLVVNGKPTSAQYRRESPLGTEIVNCVLSSHLPENKEKNKSAGTLGRLLRKFSAVSKSVLLIVSDKNYLW